MSTTYGRAQATLLKGLLPAALILFTVSSANAGAILSYSVTLDAGYPDVTNLIVLNKYSNGMGATWAFTALGNPSMPSTTLITDPFPKDPVPLQGLLIGIIRGLPTDGNEAQEHVVLMMDDTAASLSNHIAWGTLFRNTLEEDLLDAIKLMTSGQDFDIIQPGIDAVFAFADGDATNGILGPGGFTYSAHFNLGSSFTIMSFSDGMQIGTGQSFINRLQAVPEPSTIGLALSGIALLGITLGRKAKRAIAA